MTKHLFINFFERSFRRKVLFFTLLFLVGMLSGFSSGVSLLSFNLFFYCLLFSHILFEEERAKGVFKVLHQLPLSRPYLSRLIWFQIVVVAPLVSFAGSLLAFLIQVAFGRADLNRFGYLLLLHLICVLFIGTSFFLSYIAPTFSSSPLKSRGISLFFFAVLMLGLIYSDSSMNQINDWLRNHSMFGCGLLLAGITMLLFSWRHAERATAPLPVLERQSTPPASGRPAATHSRVLWPFTRYRRHAVCFFSGFAISLCLPIVTSVVKNRLPAYQVEGLSQIIQLLFGLVILAAAGSSNFLWLAYLRALRMLPMKSLRLSAWLLTPTFLMWLGCLSGLLLSAAAGADPATYNSFYSACAVALPLALFSVNLALEYDFNSFIVTFPAFLLLNYIMPDQTPLVVSTIIIIGLFALSLFILNRQLTHTSNPYRLKRIQEMIDRRKSFQLR